jgi:hypothetical protein
MTVSVTNGVYGHNAAPQYDANTISNAYGLYTGRLQQVDEPNGRITGRLRDNMNSLSPTDTTLHTVYTYYQQFKSLPIDCLGCHQGEANDAGPAIGAILAVVDPGGPLLARLAAVFRAARGAEIAAEGGQKLLWTSWQNYPKVTQAGREYAQIGDRLYTQHAVDRLQPSGLGAPAGATGAGRSISPNFVDDVLSSTRGVPVKGPSGEARLSFTSGTVQVITENNVVITVITR